MLPQGTLFVCPPFCMTHIQHRVVEKSKKDTTDRHCLAFNFSRSDANSCSYVLLLWTDIEFGSIGFPSAAAEHSLLTGRADRV